MLNLKFTQAFRRINGIKQRLDRTKNMDFGEQMFEGLQDYYEFRVWDRLEGSFGQEIGRPPTPMYETWLLRDDLRIDKEGFEMWEWGVHIEVEYFGPIWDPVEDELIYIEEYLAALIELGK